MTTAAPREITLRRGNPSDAERCGAICFEAFNTLAERHGFPPDFPAPEIAIGLMSLMLGREDVYSVVAEVDGRVVGSNFLWENGVIAGIGPITVETEGQNAATGRRMMEDVLRRAAERRFVGVRLVQAAYHNRSMALYTKLGFCAREPLSLMAGTPPAGVAGHDVRPATEADVPRCNQLCFDVHGHDRGPELLGAVRQGGASVVEHGGRITGYTSGVGFLGHAVAETNDSLKALIAAAGEFSGPGFLLPTRNTEVLRWSIENGLRIAQPMTLMSIGLYNEPRGPFLTSVLY